MKKIIVIALAIVVAFAGAAFADANRTFVSLSDVLDGLRGGAEQSAGNSYAMVVYVSGGNEALTSVALDAAGKPLLRGLALNVFAQRIGAGDQSIADFLDSIGGGGGEVDLSWLDGEFWQDGFDENGVKRIQGTEAYSRFAVDQDGRIWFVDLAHSWELACLDPSTGIITYIEGTYSGDHSIAIDSEGRVWFNDFDDEDDFVERLACYDPSTGLLTHVPETYVSGWPYGGIVIDSNGNVVFRDMWDDICLAIYNPSTGTLTRVPDVIPSGDEFTPDPHGNVWFWDYGFWPNLLACYNSSTGTLTYIEECPYNNTNFEIDTEGNLWLPSGRPDSSDNLARFDPETKTLICVEGTEVSGAIVIGPDGSIWFRDASHSGNLAKYDPSTEQVTHIEDTNAWVINVDSQGKLWVENYSEDFSTPCLAFYDPSTGHVVNIEGASADDMIAFDPHGNAWFIDRANGYTLSVYSPYLDTTGGE